MQVLVGWDNPSEAEAISLFLNLDELEAVVTTDPQEFESAAESGVWDVIFIALNFPSEEQSFSLFERLRVLQPDTPILGAVFQGEIVRLAKFVSNGLQGQVIRDPQGDFILLLRTLIESAHTTVVAQRSRRLAERLREEIDSVRRLQESVIPRDLPMPSGYRISARYEPAQIRVLGDQPVILAGGDYYDVFTLDSNNVILMVGDAAGHGIKACMSIMTMRTLIHMIHSNQYHNTADFVTEINRRLSKEDIIHGEGGFITLLYCALNTATREIQWTSAGHPMPMLQRLDTNEICTLAGGDLAGMPLGIDVDEKYESYTMTLPENSRLLLYSDGLADAFPSQADEYVQFGEQGIINCLKSSVKLPLDQALDQLFRDSHAFTRGEGRHDDTSAVLIEQSNGGSSCP